MRDRHAYPARVSRVVYDFSGEFCLRLKPYLVVKIAPDVLTQHCCQVCILAMMFCRPDCRLCAGMCGKSGNSSEPAYHVFWPVDTPAGQHGIWKNSLHLIFTFYLNRDTSASSIARSPRKHKLVLAFHKELSPAPYRYWEMIENGNTWLCFPKRNDNG